MKLVPVVLIEGAPVEGAPSVFGKACTGCNKMLPLEQFHRKAESPSGRGGKCKACCRMYKVAWYYNNQAAAIASACAYQVEHRERHLMQARRNRAENLARDVARGKAWKLANPERVQASNAARRARKRNADIVDFTAAQWQQLLTAYNHQCAYCELNRPLTVDHLVPLSRGGDHTLTNIVPACITCNCSKQRKTALEYLLWKLTNSPT